MLLTGCRLSAILEHKFSKGALDLPDCGYLKDYNIKVERGQYHVSLTPAGEIDICNILENAFPGTKCVVLEDMTSWFGGQTLAISGMHPKHEELQQFLDLLSNHLTINDSLDECHALALRSLPPTEERSDWKRTKMGELVYRAKYWGNPNACRVIAGHMARFIVAHPRYQRAEFVVAAPRSRESDMFDLPSEMVKLIASALRKSIAIAEKTRQTNPQKELWKWGEIELLKANVKDSMIVQISLLGESVILVDETYGSGATLEELDRACRAAGATEVLGLAATKNAKFTYGIDLGEGPWE